MLKRELLARAAELGVDVPAGATKAEISAAIALVEDGGPLDLTPARRRRLLELVRGNRQLGNVAALRQVGLRGTRGELRKLLDGDVDLAEELREARGYGNTQIRNELFRRAIEGVDEPVFHQGEIVGHVRRYSDRLLAKMADAYLPEFRDARQRLELTGPGGQPVQVEVDGGRVTGLSEVFELARQFGIGLAEGAREGLGAGAARGALPAAADVLSDPANG